MLAGDSNGDGGDSATRFAASCCILGGEFQLISLGLAWPGLRWISWEMNRTMVDSVRREIADEMSRLGWL
jgi:hypothetical protein